MVNTLHVITKKKLEWYESCLETLLPGVDHPNRSNARNTEAITML